MALPEVIDIDPVAIIRRKPDCTIDRIPLADPILPGEPRRLAEHNTGAEFSLRRQRRRCRDERDQDDQADCQSDGLHVAYSFLSPLLDQPGPSRISRHAPASEKGSSSNAGTLLLLPRLAAQPIYASPVRHCGIYHGKPRRFIITMLPG